ncbi:uncharacterized protein MELLADRAFT_71876 [Melampsora larici-populina 98AG31]|uniref:Uncharacterized protein n=1 Tax=Melampsora larici-populina (strain 98AG31 / pathotype 3-4-7) TaxID=747676 RepID=F4RLL2_MELLP|nr:uncharacterized protein MELLADRAFT_71876 [Melampsora larici-populina 98AG31]EGG06730.1 hypothetical protein MELLADRAFT_71876 [Melampsora larici-populina 98AG31]
MVANFASRARIARLLEEDVPRRHISYDAHPRVDVATWTPRVCYMTAQFWPNEIIALHQRLRFPQSVSLDNGCIETGLTALAMLLEHCHALKFQAVTTPDIPTHSWEVFAPCEVLPPMC